MILADLLFELMAQEMSGEVAVMRIRGGQFRFNPCPLAWALKEKARQEREGSYLRPLADGGYLPCPVEQTRLFFEAWLDSLVGQGRALDPSQKNLLDRALKGGEASGRGGFFRDFENQCQQYLRALEKDPDCRLPPPRPLIASTGRSSTCPRLARSNTPALSWLFRSRKNRHV